MGNSDLFLNFTVTLHYLGSRPGFCRGDAPFLLASAHQHLMSGFQVSPGNLKVTCASPQPAQTPTNRATVMQQFLFQKKLKGEEVTSLNWKACAQLGPKKKINLVLN